MAPSDRPSLTHKSSRVRFTDGADVNGELTDDVPAQPADSQSIWHIPDYTEDHSQDRRYDVDARSTGPHETTLEDLDLDQHDRRQSAQSEATLNNDQADPYSMSSFRPRDLEVPPSVYDKRASNADTRRLRSALRRNASVVQEPVADTPYVEDARVMTSGRRRFLGLDWRRINLGGRDDDDDEYDFGHDDYLERRPTLTRAESRVVDEALNTTGRFPSQEPRNWRSYFFKPAGERPNMHRRDSAVSMLSAESDALDLEADDPKLTGRRLKYLDDQEDAKRMAMKSMTYKQRREDRERLRIVFNTTGYENRQMYILKLAEALMRFGAPSHRVESVLNSAAGVLEVPAEFVLLPGMMICSFGDVDTRTSETHFLRCNGGIALTNLHELHGIYRAVSHDEISARLAMEQIDALLAKKPMYPVWARIMISFLMSALICPLAFGGSVVDMWIAGVGAVLLSFCKEKVAAKSAMYANVYEVTMAIVMSFVARLLSSFHYGLFCYTAISSASIVGILPGYLILSSSLDLASKNITCGSVKMVYALIYTLFLGFGLQIGSDLFLVTSPSSRHEIQELADNITTIFTVAGSFVPDNVTSNLSMPTEGIWTFTNSSTQWAERHIIQGCYRSRHSPPWEQPLPLWTAFIFVPVFSVLSSLNNQQKIRSKELPIMVFISCTAYTVNYFANQHIFGRSDIVSGIGALVVGLMGNIYSRTWGGTAFTSMVTGVLFLVPSGLSAAGGLTDDNGVDIGGAMISVTIGITVGLFMSLMIVYLFGNRKKAGSFSF